MAVVFGGLLQGLEGEVNLEREELERERFEGEVVWKRYGMSRVGMEQIPESVRIFRPFST